MSGFIIVIGFHINKEYISQHLCIQKDVKNNCCKGKCYLKKEFRKDEQRQKTPMGNDLNNKSKYELFVETFNPANFCIANPFLPIIAIYKVVETNSMAFSVFHPPQC